MLRIAVLGCGRIGRMHAANIAAHPRARLAAVYDIDRQSAEAVATGHNVRAAETAEARSRAWRRRSFAKRRRGRDARIPCGRSAHRGGGATGRA